MSESADPNQAALLTYLRRQISQLNSDDEVQSQQALTNLVLGMPASIAVLLDAISKKEVRPDRASTFANFISMNGYNDQAESLFRAINEIEPNNAAHLNNLAVVLLRQGQLAKVKEAIDLLDRAVDIDVENFGNGAIDQPAWKNRDIANSLVRLINKENPELAKVKQKEPQDATEALKKEIRHQNSWKAFWETMLSISDPVVKYLPTLLFGVITAISLVALMGKLVGIPPEAGTYSIAVTLTIVLSFVGLKFLSQRGIHNTDLEIGPRQNQFFALYRTKLQVQ